MNEGKKVDIQQGWFMANGRKYVVASSISIDRWKQYEKLEPRLTYGLNFDDMFKMVKKAYELLNEQRFADSSVVLHNIMSSIKDVEDEKRIHPALLMCSLVINREDEDASLYDESVAVSKIEDWTKEGLNMLDFFTMSLNSIKGFRETYVEFIQRQADMIVKKEKI